MKCPKCGKEIANDSVFCNYCGAKIAQICEHVSRTITCQNCGREIAQDSVFCEYCGTKIDKGKKSWTLWVTGTVPI